MQKLVGKLLFNILNLALKLRFVLLWVYSVSVCYSFVCFWIYGFLSVEIQKEIVVQDFGLLTFELLNTTTLLFNA